MIDERRFYELPDGVATTGFFGRIDATVYRDSVTGLIVLTLKQTNEGRAPRWVRIDLDNEFAGLLVDKIEATR